MKWLIKTNLIDENGDWVEVEKAFAQFIEINDKNLSKEDKEYLDFSMRMYNFFSKERSA